MRLPVVAEISTVDAVWLGPPRNTLPWRARYVAYGVGLVVFVLLQAIERRLGIGLGFFSLAYSVLATVGLTRLILSVVDDDAPTGLGPGCVRPRGRWRLANPSGTRPTYAARLGFRPSPPA